MNQIWSEITTILETAKYVTNISFHNTIFYHVVMGI